MTAVLDIGMYLVHHILSYWLHTGSPSKDQKCRLFNNIDFKDVLNNINTAVPNLEPLKKNVHFMQNKNIEYLYFNFWN